MELPITEPVLQFTALVAVALVVQMIFERIHVPSIIGLLVIGAIAGPGGAGVLPRGDVMELLGHLGLIYLMFIAGLEVDLDVFKTHRRETGTFGVSAFLLSLLPAIALGLVLGFGWQAALLLGTLLSSHTLLAYPIIHRLGLQHRTASVTTVGGTLVTDTLALILLAITIQTDGDDNGIWSMARPLVLLAILVALALWLVPRFSRSFLDQQNIRRAEKALFVLAVLLILSTLAELIEAHEILGAFLAGVCLNRVLKERPELQEHVEFLGRMLFVPFFFIATGMRLELDVLSGQPRVWGLAGALLGIVIFGKSAASWLSGRLYNYPRTDRLMMIGLTLPQAAATLAVTVTAREAGLFNQEILDAVILLIFATCIAGPLLTRYAGRKVSAEKNSNGNTIQ